MPHPRLVVLVLSLALLAGACGQAAPGAAATVDGVAIPRSLIEEAVRETSRGLEGLDAQQRREVIDERQRNLLTMGIVHEVVRSVAGERGVEAGEAQRAAVIDEIAESVGGADQLDAAIRSADMSRGFFDDVFVSQQALIAALRDELTEGRDFSTRTVRHILVDTEDDAADALARIDDGESFGEVARDVSRDAASTGRGGMLDPAPRGTWTEAFDEAVWESGFDELVGPVETPFGFHVLEVLDEDTVAAEDVTTEQRTQLAADELNRLILEALEMAEIRVDPGLGRWDPDRGEVVAAAGPVGQAPLTLLGGGPAPGPAPSGLPGPG